MKNKIYNNIKNIKIEDELKKSYLDYAMSVIIGRALPDVRDGLKPVHRRILYSMYILKNFYNKQYKKSARIVGDVIGKYHPHGDNAVYETIVRMAQNFSLRYPLIDGQGNFGSIDGDSAAAMRYTEIKMSKISQEFLKDIDKNTVKFIKNYDNTEKIPEILPTKIPNILINGCTGIAVGMATNIPPHNITEIINTILIFLKNKKITTKKLMNYIKGPDFPTGGIIENTNGIYNAYKTGKGLIKIKAKIKKEINKKKNKKYIIIYELPYQINKSKIIKKIVELTKNKKIEGISNIRDESNKDGIRVVIKVKKNIKRNQIIKKLYYFTNLEISYGINIVALYKKKAKTLNLKKIINIFIKYRKTLIINKTLFKLKKNKKKLHIYKGLIITLTNINKIIKIIKNSENTNIIKNELKKYKWKINKEKNIKNNYHKMSEKQINSILKLNLGQLTKIEKNKIKKKYINIKEKIIILKKILTDKNTLINIIKNELIKIKKKFGDKRLTIINTKKKNNTKKKIKIKDLITKIKIIIIITKFGYISYKKINKLKIYHKGTKGKKIKKIKKNDCINNILISNTHKKILLFSNKGKCFEIKTYILPYIKKKYIGKPIINFINIKKNEKITYILEKKKINKFKYIIITTKLGTIKKIKTKKIKLKNKKGLNIIKLKKNDKIISVNYINEKEEIMLFTKLGKTNKFKEKNIRETNRNSYGVKGIKLNIKDKLISCITIKKKDYFSKKILTISENGYGKKININEFNLKKRNTKGIIFSKINKKNGNIVKVIKINNKKSQIIIITNKGNFIRIKSKEIKTLKRNTKGIILMRINKKKNEKINCIKKIE